MAAGGQLLARRLLVGAGHVSAISAAFSGSHFVSEESVDDRGQGVSFINVFALEELVPLEGIDGEAGRKYRHGRERSLFEYRSCPGEKRRSPVNEVGPKINSMPMARPPCSLLWDGKGNSASPFA